MEFYTDNNGELHARVTVKNIIKNNSAEFTFEKVKELYTQFRKKEWEKLRTFLEDKKKKIVKGGNSGHGVKKYTSNGHLNVAYDLTNWLWIEVIIADVTIFVSFQPVNKDSKNENAPALADRIGISWYTDKYTPNTIWDNMIITDIDLPLDNNKKEALFQIIFETAENAKR